MKSDELNSSGVADEDTDMGEILEQNDQNAEQLQQEINGPDLADRGIDPQPASEEVPPVAAEGLEETKLESV